MKNTAIALGLTPSFEYYDVAFKVLEKLIEFGVNVSKFTTGSTGFTFSYTQKKRPGLNYEELEAIRTIANPARDRDHTVHQMTMFELTDLFIHPDEK